MEVWKLEHIEALKTFHAQGCSYAAAVAKLNAMFATSYTRSAAVGKVHRLGLIVRVRQPAIAHAPPASSATLQAEPKPEMVVLRCAGVSPRHVAFTELEADHCRYPYGEGPYTFCGHSRQSGSSYCPAHADLVAAPEIKSDRVAVTLNRAGSRRPPTHFANNSKSFHLI